MTTLRCATLRFGAFAFLQHTDCPTVVLMSIAATTTTKGHDLKTSDTPFLVTLIGNHAISVNITQYHTQNYAVHYSPSPLQSCRILEAMVNRKQPMRRVTENSYRTPTQKSFQHLDILRHLLCFESSASECPRQCSTNFNIRSPVASLQLLSLGCIWHWMTLRLGTDDYFLTSKGSKIANLTW